MAIFSRIESESQATPTFHPPGQGEVLSSALPNERYDMSDGAFTTQCTTQTGDAPERGAPRFSAVRIVWVHSPPARLIERLSLSETVDFHEQREKSRDSSRGSHARE